MALIKCRECGKKISDKTNICPNCGYKNKSVSKLIIIILSVIIVILLFLLSILYIKDELNDEREDKYNIDNNYITNSDALDIALKDLNVNIDDIYDLSSELESKFGKTVYDIDFKYNRFEYEYYIDAKSGEIIKSFRQLD